MQILRTWLFTREFLGATTLVPASKYRNYLFAINLSCHLLMLSSFNLFQPLVLGLQLLSL
jgi:hypothetical protein